MSPILTIQRRMMTLGKVRLGEKGPKGEPRKRETFRFTSASQALLDAVAVKYGGTVRPWEGAPDEGYYEVGTDARELGIILPPVFSAADGSPTTSYSQWFELWSAAGCQRRCDGLTDSISGKPCLCQKKIDADGEEARECKITTRVSFMLPDIPGLGVWVCESHGWNSAVELPGTLEVLTLAAAENKFIPAVLRAEPRTKKEPGKPTKKFIVPVIDLPGVTVNQLAAGDVPLALNAPASRPDRPALPAGPAPPTDSRFTHETAEHGEPPPLPAAGSEEANRWADESAVKALLELAAQVSEEAHDKASAAIGAHRDSNGGRVDAGWLRRQWDALEKKLPAGTTVA